MQPAGRAGEQQPVALRAAAVQVHGQLGAVRRGRQAAQPVGSRELEARALRAHERDERVQRAGCDEQQPPARHSRGDPAQRGDGGEQVAQAERAQHDDRPPRHGPGARRAG